MGKWICEACNTPCTFDSGNYGGAVNPSGGCGKENWREVKEEPEKTPAGVVTWTNVPPSGCVLIPHMAFECPECKERDERIDGLRESHRDFVDMHNATKRDKDAEIARLGKHVRSLQAGAGEWPRSLREGKLRSDLSAARRDNARLRNEADARGMELARSLTLSEDRMAGIEALDRHIAKLRGEIEALRAKPDVDAANVMKTHYMLDSILELLQGSLAGKEEAAAARSKITKQNKDAARINEVQNARVDGQLDRLDELLHGLEPGTPPEMTGPESNDAGKITGKD